MAEEIDDNEFFQQDFTTASEWEIFNARLDEVFHEWKLPYVETKRPLRENELFLAEWNVKTETIFFANVELTVSRHCAKIEDDEIKDDDSNKEDAKLCQTHLDLMEMENDFCIYDDKSDKIHPIAKWYGLRDFVVIDPVGNPIINESQIRLLLSSACITVAEVKTPVPVFVHIMMRDLHVYMGVCESPSQRVNFDIVALEHTPPTCKYLSGLLSMFKGKVGHHYLHPITISVRFSYSLTEFLDANYAIKCKIPFSADSDEESEESNSAKGSFYALPYGVSIDPVSELILNCSWPHIVENVILDSAAHSDLDPILSPSWSIRVNYKHQPLYFMTDAILEFVKLSENSRTLGSIVGSSYDFGSTLNLEGINPLDLLTESKIPSITSVLPNVRRAEGKKSKAKKSEGPIKEDELMQMLYYLFPDAQTDPEHSYDLITSDIFDPLRIKSAVPDSLVFRLSALLATCNSYFGGISALAHLWAEFTQEMRYRVERCIQIPGVAPGFPDSRTCLLHQKLQMLNICMERRRLREGGLPFSMTQQDKSGKDDSEDEFYDCATDEEADGNYPLWRKPEGRRSKLGDLTLVDSPEPLYVPVTQEPAPKTDDQLEDDAEVMLKLGPASELCTHMMTASLLSDMESFKAANPNGKLEDFIRWYSPRDWIEEPDDNGVIKGQLSQRMLIPGNTWQTVWGQAKPVPARRQRRLFDDTKESEKVLHFFETRTIGQICQLTLPALYHSAILKIKSELQHSNFAESFSENFDKVMSNLCKLTRENWITPNMGPTYSIPSHKRWETLLQDIANLEHLAIQTNSISLKLFGEDARDEEEKQTILTLLKGMEVELDGGAKHEISVRLLAMFSDARQSKDEFNTEKDTPSQLYLPEPVRKEYILRASGKTTSKIAGGPQFLRAILDKHMRLCGAFTTNTTFV